MTMAQMSVVACNAPPDLFTAPLPDAVFLFVLLQPSFPAPLIGGTQPPDHLSGAGQIEPEPQKIHAFRNREDLRLPVEFQVQLLRL